MGSVVYFSIMLGVESVDMDRILCVPETLRLISTRAALMTCCDDSIIETGKKGGENLLFK
jgi:hypothetical protein